MNKETQETLIKDLSSCMGQCVTYTGGRSIREVKGVYVPESGYSRNIIYMIEKLIEENREIRSEEMRKM